MATINYELYLSSKTYIDNKGYRPYWQTMEDFYNGKQHRNTKKQNIPHATTNICRLDVQSKASKINGTPFTLNFTAFDNSKSTLKLQKFDKYMMKRLREDAFNYQACVNAYVYGNEITYYRWDDSETTINGRYVGGLAIDHIDIRQFRVANPNLSSLQKQKWVMFFKTEELKAVRDLCEDQNLKKQILPDDMGSIEEITDKIDESEIEHKLVTVFTRFFRIDGEVCYQISTKDIDITPIIALNPNKKVSKNEMKIIDDTDERDVEDYDIDSEDASFQTVKHKTLSKSHYKKIKQKFNLYPFAIFTPTEKNGCFYGKSDIEELIDNQKIINFADSMIALDMMNNAWGKIVVKEGALNGQVINNAPGQVLVDYVQGQVNGIKRLEGQPMNSSVYNFNENFINRIRNINGMSEVFTGEAMSRDLSGYAIQLLQEQSNTQIEQAQRLFWNYCEDKAYIRLLFYKFYFDEIQYLYELSDDEYNQQLRARAMVIARDRKKNINIPTSDYPMPNRIQNATFSPTDYQDDTFDITIEAGRGIKYSEIVVADMVNTLFMNGNFQNMDTHHLEAYMKLNPLIPESTKADFKEILNAQKKDEITQLKTMLEQTYTQFGQLLNYTQNLQNQLGVTNQYVDNLTKEFKNKINLSNDVIKQQNAKLQSLSNIANAGIPKADNYTS